MRNLLLIIKKLCCFSLLFVVVFVLFEVFNSKQVGAYAKNPNTTTITMQSEFHFEEDFGGGGGSGTSDNVSTIDSNREIFTGSTAYTQIEKRTYKKWKPNFTYNYHVETAYKQIGCFTKFKEKISVPFYHYRSLTTTIGLTTGKTVSETKATTIGLKGKLDMGGGKALEVGYEKVRSLTITNTMSNSYAVTLNSNNESGYYTYYAVYQYQKFKSVDVFGPKSEQDKYTETLEAKILISSDFGIRLAFSGENFF